MTEKNSVGIITSDEDLSNLIACVIETAGFQTASENLWRIRAEPDRYGTFLTDLDPKVLVMDIPPPYQPNLQLVDGLISLPQSRGRKFVITATDKTGLESLVTKPEITGFVKQPFDLDELIQTVTKGCQDTPYTEMF